MSALPTIPFPEPQPKVLWLHPAELLPPDPDIRESRDLDTLRESIRQDGVQQPLTAFPDPERLRVLDGQTRRLICLELGVEKVPVIVVAKPATRDDLLKAMLSPNVNRNTISNRELGTICLDLMASRGCGQKQVARFLSIPEPRVCKALAEVRNVDAETARGLPGKAVYQLARLKDELKNCQAELAERFRKEKLSCDDLADLVNRKLAEAGRKKPKEPPVELSFGGFHVTAPACKTLEQLLEALAVLTREARRGKELHLALASLPALLDGKEGK